MGGHSIIDSIILWLLCFCSPVLGISMGEIMANDKPTSPGPADVHIGPNSIMVPLNYIILVNREYEYGAIKFNDFWHGEDERDRYARYTSYYRNNKSGSLLGHGVQVHCGELSFPKPRGVGRLSFSFGTKDVKIGPINLLWTGRGFVHFYSEGQAQRDYGIQLAPTKWTEISEVNVFDSRLQWYKYDSTRQRKIIPIDNLWKN